jgi:virulence-associated protein VagC
MKTEVTEQGITIPKQLLEGVTEVEIRKEKNYILIIPLSGEDPMLRFGKNPVSDEITDASVNHDKYIYGK